MRAPATLSSPETLSTCPKSYRSPLGAGKYSRQNEMKQFLKLLILVPLAVAILAVAEANRHPVQIYLDPFAGSSPEGTQITVPLFFVILVAIMIGVVFGSMVTYFEQGRHRRAARLARADADTLRAELARLSRTRPGEKGKA
jgi:uncharacterized integral membrane protein